MDNIARYEQKFLISPREAERVKKLLSIYCDPDPASERGPYRVESLYYDNDQLSLYQATALSRPERLKLRVRYYDPHRVYIEIKRKIRGMIWKSRTSLPTLLWHDLIGTRRSDRSRREVRGEADASLNEFGQDVLSQFLTLCEVYDAQPTAWVRYDREGYFSPDEDYARITFDTRLCAALPRVLRSSVYPSDASQPHSFAPRWTKIDLEHHFKSGQADIILELKSTRSVPSWMVELSRMINHSAVGVSKYALAVRTLHPHTLTQQFDHLWDRGKA